MSMKQAFTLIELLVVVAIMALLGTASVGGYRQMQRGMEERGVMQNVQELMTAAFERAQIDRQPVAVLFYNETLVGKENADENVLVVGKAVAIRRCGRISAISRGLLIDEFGDLEEYDESGEYKDETTSDANTQGSAKNLYRFVNLNSIETYLVNEVRQSELLSLPYATYQAIDNANDQTEPGRGKVQRFGYKVLSGSATSWKVGDGYGFEFQTIELPRGYIFGSSYKSGITDPIQNVTTIFYLPQKRQSDSIVISSIRLGSEAAQQVGTVRADTSSMN